MATGFQTRRLIRDPVRPHTRGTPTPLARIDDRSADTEGDCFILDAELDRSLAAARERDIQRELTTRRHVKAIAASNAMSARPGARDGRQTRHRASRPVTS
jgi:hypothetical protein